MKNSTPSKVGGGVRILRLRIIMGNKHQEIGQSVCDNCLLKLLVIAIKFSYFFIQAVGIIC